MTAQAVLTARLDRAAARLVAGASKRKTRQLRRRAARALEALTLESYVAWINADGGTLKPAADWRAEGVTTAAALAAYLDAMHRHAMRQDAMYGGWDD